MKVSLAKMEDAIAGSLPGYTQNRPSRGASARVVWLGWEADPPDCYPKLPRKKSPNLYFQLTF
jgi:hypothetical protein